MKKIILSIAVVALFGTMALTSCKSSTAPATDSTAVEEAVAPAVDTAAAAAVDTAAVADSAM